MLQAQTETHPVEEEETTLPEHEENEYKRGASPLLLIHCPFIIHINHENKISK